jgi:preprotein translocase subunit YajC
MIFFAILALLAVLVLLYIFVIRPRNRRKKLQTDYELTETGDKPGEPE